MVYYPLLSTAAGLAFKLAIAGSAAFAVAILVNTQCSAHVIADGTSFAAA